jgi:Mn2+/Fe2+ NRAMP family transporter
MQLSGLKGKIEQFAASFGPAWIVMIADVDATSILTAAHFCKMLCALVVGRA